MSGQAKYLIISKYARLVPDRLPVDSLALVARLLAGEVLQVLWLQQPVLLHAARHLPGQHGDTLSGVRRALLTNIEKKYSRFKNHDFDSILIK